MSARFQIGSITAGYREIRDGKQYDRYFSSPDRQDKVIIEDGEVEQTVDLMKRVVWKYLSDTKKIATVLSGKTLEESCHNIWAFLFNHIQYRLDQKGLEQLRRPNRSWSERKEGIDCDCFSIFASSILTNLGIAHSFRITKYEKNVFQHVYVVVPLKRGYYIIDPVLSRPNYEKPFTEKKDFPMSMNGINVAVLSGTADSDLYNAVMATHLDGVGLGSLNENEELEALKQHLITTCNAVSQHPEMIAMVDDPDAFLKMLNYAINHWNTPNRDKALEILAENEDRFNLQLNIADLNDELDDDEELLGRLFKRKKKKGSRKGFFKSIKKAVKNVGKGIKKAAKTVIRYNPLTISARNGFLLALKLNVKKMASRLKWAYATKEQATRKGLSEAQWNRSKEALQKVEKLFAEKLQGKRSALKKAILKGKAGNLNGVFEGASELAGLGEPVTAASGATLIATATPVIVAVVKILKDSGVMNPNESKTVDMSESDIQAMIQSGDQPGSGAYNPDDDFDFDFDTGESNSTEETGSNKLISFIKNNPLVAVGGVAVAGGLGYLLFGKGKKKSKDGLSGISKKPTPTLSQNRIKTMKLN